MHLGQIRGTTYKGLGVCFGKSPWSKEDNPSKGQNSKRERERERESLFPNGLSPFYNEDLCMASHVANLGLMYRPCLTRHDSLVLRVPNFNRLHMLKENCSCIHFV